MLWVVNLADYRLTPLCRGVFKLPPGMYADEELVFQPGPDGRVHSVVLAGMVFFTAYEIAQDALFTPTRQATVDIWMLVGVVVATVIPLVFSHFELNAGRAANSPALIADAKEYRAHVFTTGVVFAALLAQWFDFPLDRIAALVIVVAITKTGWDLLSDGMRVLLDASLDADTLLRIRELIISEPAVAEVKWVTGRNAGRYRFVEAEVVLRIRDLEKAEATTRRIETQIRETVPHLERVLIHAEPIERTRLHYAVPLADREGRLSEHFGEAPYFALFVVHLAAGVVEQQQKIVNPYLEEEKAKGIRVAEWLVNQKVDVVLLRRGLQGRGPVYVFSDAGVEMQEIQAEALPQAIASIIDSELQDG